MAGVKKSARLPALALAAAVAALATCSNPGGYLDAVNDEVKESLDMYLAVSSVSPAKDALVNPSCTIKIDFDRSLDTATIISGITLTPTDAAVAAPAWSWAYNDDLKRLTVSSSLEGSEEYQIAIRQGLKGSRGEPLRGDYVSTFSTYGLPSGSVVINGRWISDSVPIENPTYTNSPNVTLYFAVNGLTNSYKYSQSRAALEGEPATDPIGGTPWPVIGPITLDVSDRDGDGDADDEIAVYARFKKDSTEIYSDIVSDTIIYDITPPDAPSVTGATTTNDTSPTWTWTPSATSPGNGRYRCQLDATAPAGWVETSTASWAPASALTANASHALYVQERDEAGNWSASGSAAIEVDTTPPGAPTVDGTSPTNDSTPAWTWNQNASSPGNGHYRLQLDSTSGSWTETAETSWSPTAPFADGSTHTLYIQERDEAGNWSASGSKPITIDLSAPGSPVVSGPELTNSATPTWTWTSGGSGNGTFAYALDSSTRPESSSSTSSPSTTALTFTPSTNLTEGTHTLYAWERNTAENWSSYGYWAITIDTTAPSVPIVSGATPTNAPAWAWTGGGGGSGTFAFAMDGSATRPTTSSATTSASTTDTSFTPDPASMTEGEHSLHVWERDAAGNWSSYGSKPIEYDKTPPSAPVITGPTTPSADRTPSYSWTDTGDLYSYRLYYSKYVKMGEIYILRFYDIVSWTEPADATSFAQATDLPDEEYYFQVKAFDIAGNETDSVVHTHEIDAAPNSPLVNSDSTVTGRYSVDATPTWTWGSGGFGNGTFAYSLDSSIRPDTGSPTASPSTDLTSFTPATALTDGAHTLYVWERDDTTPEASWSASPGSFTLTITPVFPLNGRTIYTLTPTLYWRSITRQRNSTYTVERKSGKEDFTAVATGLTVNEFSDPDPLTVDVMYTWRVVYTPLLGGIAYWPDSTGATFTTASKR